MFFLSTGGRQCRWQHPCEFLCTRSAENSGNTPNGDAGGHLENGLGAAFGGTLRRAVGHKDDVISLQLQIRGLSRHDFLKRERNLLGAAIGFTDEARGIESGVGIRALSESDGLQDSDVLAVFED